MPDGRRIVVVGRLMDEPKVRRSGPGGVAFLKMELAVTRNGKQERGASRSAVFIGVSVRGCLADICVQSLRKGQSVAVAGSLRVQRTEAADRKGRPRLEVIADGVQVLEDAKAPEAPREATRQMRDGEGS